MGTLPKGPTVKDHSACKRAGRRWPSAASMAGSLLGG